MRPALSHALTLTVCLLLIVSLSLLLPLSPHAPFSEWENRALALFPTPTLRSLTSGDFSRDLSDFCADQFPFRTFWLGLRAELERLLGAQEVDGILLGRDGYLIPRNEYDDLCVARENLEACHLFLEHAEQATFPVSVAVVPRAVDVLRAYLPALYDPTRAEAVYTHVQALLPDQIDLLPALRQAADEGQEIWYRTDHHWTTDGAYLAYTLLAPALGVTPLSPEAFSRQVVSEHFLGTSHSASGLWQARADRVVLYRYAGDEDVEIYEHATRTSTLGFYYKEKLRKKDQYAVFLGGNYAHLSIRDLHAPDKPTLLLFKDSFANALIPFLSRHFHLEVVDLRYFSGSASSLVDALSPDRVLLLFGADTLATQISIRKLGYP